jgi:putative FmdB family regulatory protein
MPLFEYRCEGCDSTFERIVFAGDQEKITCPCCNGENVEKLMSCASFIGGSGLGACAPKPSSGFS